MAVTEPGIVIGGEVFPIPSSYSLGDSLLIADLTGMEMEEYSAALEDMRDGGVTSRAFAGLVAVAVRAKHPTWNRAKVIRFVENVDFDNFELVGGEDDDLPPAEAPAEQETPSP